MAGGVPLQARVLSAVCAPLALNYDLASPQRCHNGCGWCCCTALQLLQANAAGDNAGGAGLLLCAACSHPPALTCPPAPAALLQHRYDESSDAEFYEQPRFVTHIDDGAIKSLTQ